MEAPKLEALRPPPGIIGSLRAGFDMISTHLTAILLPVALDLLLWFGPRLSIKRLFVSLQPWFEQSLRAGGRSPAELQSALEAFKSQTSQLDSFNLLGLLRTFPIGISSLLGGESPALTPLGQPRVMQVGSFADIFFLFLGITLVGWIGGAVYFRWIASLVAPSGQSVRGRALWQSLTLSILAAIVTVIVGLPVFLILYALNVISPAISQGAMLFLGIISMWLLVPLFFAAHGIFIRSQNVFASILSGLQMARFSLPNSSLFVLSVLFIGIGLNYLWVIPKPDSWMLLVGIIGHGFITTALLAASFIYYRDMTAWMQSVFERLQAGATSTKS